MKIGYDFMYDSVCKLLVILFFVFLNVFIIMGDFIFLVVGFISNNSKLNIE